MENEKFSVRLVSYDDLSPIEQSGASNNGVGKEWANYIRVSYEGETLFLENDACEPEDARFSRDYSWILRAISSAYELGLKSRDLDGALWCHGCGAISKKDCECGPIAEND
jgi:hypothetical protein